MVEVTALRHAVHGSVLEPDDVGFADALAGFNLAARHQPLAVVVAEDAADVAASVSFARDAALPVRVLVTGHGSAPATDGIVISLSRLTDMSIDPQTRLATLGGGVTWGAVVDAAAPLGLLPVSGSAPTVGAVGLVVGGGLGPLARSHGFASDWVRGFSVVTGDGEVVAATEHEHPDLFWALRGGKGGLGVVIEMLVELVPIEHLTGGNVTYPPEAIEPVLRAWVDYTTRAPQHVTTSAAIIRMPPIEQVPEPLRGKTVLQLRYANPGGGVDEGFAAVRATADPIVDRIRDLPLGEVATIHDDPTQPGYGWAAGTALATFDDDLVTALLALAGPTVDVPLIGVEMRHVGSAVSRSDAAGGSAVGGRDAEGLLSLVGSLATPGSAQTVPAAARAVLEGVAPWTSPTTTVNFAWPGRPLDEYRTSWSDVQWERLAEVRARYAPPHLFPFGPVL